MKINFTVKDTDEENIKQYIKLFKNGQAIAMVVSKEDDKALIEVLYKLNYQHKDKSKGCNSIWPSAWDVKANYYLGYVLSKEAHKDGSQPVNGRCVIYGRYESSEKHKKDYAVMIPAWVIIEHFEEFYNEN